jgi:hypothetical protein
MGVVFKATQTALQRTVALKAIAPDLAEDASFRERFQREAHIAASIEHPNVIPVYEAGELDKTLYLMMRWVDGTDLRALLAAEGPLAPDRAVRLLRPVASALAAAHRRGLVHRDVKPANVLIARGDGDEHVYLTDFGIARHTQGDSLTRTGVFVGTVDYTAPERIEGGKGDAAADIYSFGCMLFEALTGHVPFDRPTEVVTMFAHVNDPVPHAGDEIPGIPKRLDAVIACAMAKNPADRFHSAGELASALDRALEDDDRTPVEAREPATESEQPTVAAAGPPRARDEQATATLMQTPATRHVEDRAATSAAHSGRRPSRLLIVGALIVVAAIVAIVIVVASSGGGGSEAPKASSTPFARKLSGDASVTVGSPITLPFAPTAVAAQGNGVWVAGSGKVALVAPGGIQRTLPIAGTPKGIALDPKGNVWVSGANGNTVTILQQHKDIPTGPDPGAITITNHAAWVLTAGTSAATRIDLVTQVPERKPLPSPPVAVGQAYGHVWIACQDGSVRVFGTGGTPDPIAAPSIDGVVGLTPAFGVWFLSGDGTLNRVDPRSSVAARTQSGQLQYREYKDQGSVGASAVGPEASSDTSPSIWGLSRANKTLSEIASNGPQITNVIAAIRFGAEPAQLAVGAGVVWVTLPSAKVLYPITAG